MLIQYKMGQKCCKNTRDEVDDIRRNSKHPTELRAGHSLSLSPNAIGDSLHTSTTQRNSSPDSQYKNGGASALADRSSFHFDDSEQPN